MAMTMTVVIQGAARPRRGRRVRASDDGRGRLGRLAAVPGPGHGRDVARVGPRDAVVRRGGRGGRRRVSAPVAAAASDARGPSGLLWPLPFWTASPAGTWYLPEMF